MGEKITFLKNFFKNPRQIGSIIPSSKNLAKKMTQNINYDKANVILELGAGTGPFTKYILKNKKEKTRFIVFEQNKEMVEILRKKFPKITIYNDARKMTLSLKNNHIARVDYIISSIPFSVIGKTNRKIILEQSYNNLKIGGKFVTFQYSLDLFKYLKKQYKKVQIILVPFNIPMAFVYVCTK